VAGPPTGVYPVLIWPDILMCHANELINGLFTDSPQAESGLNSTKQVASKWP